MAYLLDVVSGKVPPEPNKISLERYILEDSYITKYLSRVVKDKALVVYHVLFTLSWFETGSGEIFIPWLKVGSYIRSEQGNIIEDGSTIKRRLSDLIQNRCIKVEQQRSGPNKIKIYLPSEIQACKELIQKDIVFEEIDDTDNTDYYSNLSKRKQIYERDNRKCVYCRIELDENSFMLDHIIPVSKGGTNKKFNLVTSCEKCNQRKQNQEPMQFLLVNYRNQLISQEEYLTQKEYIEKLLATQ